MEHVEQGYRELGLLVDVNSDRMLSVLIIAVAMAAVGLVGVEYASSSIVQDSTAVVSTFL